MMEASSSKAFAKLLVNQFAPWRPCSLRILLYKGMKPVAIPAPIDENMTLGIVLDTR